MPSMNKRNPLCLHLFYLEKKRSINVDYSCLSTTSVQEKTLHDCSLLGFCTYTYCLGDPLLMSLTPLCLPLLMSLTYRYSLLL